MGRALRPRSWQRAHRSRGARLLNEHAVRIGFAVFQAGGAATATGAAVRREQSVEDRDDQEDVHGEPDPGVHRPASLQLKMVYAACRERSS